MSAPPCYPAVVVKPAKLALVYPGTSLRDVHHGLRVDTPQREPNLGAVVERDAKRVGVHELSHHGLVVWCDRWSRAAGDPAPHIRSNVCGSPEQHPSCHLQQCSRRARIGATIQVHVLATVLAMRSTCRLCPALGVGAQALAVAVRVQSEGVLGTLSINYSIVQTAVGQAQRGIRTRREALRLCRRDNRYPARVDNGVVCRCQLVQRATAKVRIPVQEDHDIDASINCPWQPQPHSPHFP
eukprot:3201612-Prymnesium_polylepis.1